MKQVIATIIGLLLSAGFLYSIPPEPPLGYRWVLNTAFSDEFNSDELDTAKWNDYYPGWEGRAPAMFLPKAISVKNGNLEIKSGVLDEPYKKYNIYGGAVTSKTQGAHFGYFECRAKASKIAMSTTFWLSNGKEPFDATANQTDSYSQELDIQEAVGGGTRFPKFRNGMNCNTHFRYIKCGAKREEFFSRGSGTKLKSEVSDDYHIYGAWWKDAREVIFYADNQLFDTVQFRTDFTDTPFDRPMQINMVTETYDWQPAPSKEDLLNDDINTAYYDWVRHYELVPVAEKYRNSDQSNVFSESVACELRKQDGSTGIIYTYQANEDYTLVLKIYDSEDELVHETREKVLAGYGVARTCFDLEKLMEVGKQYKIKSELISLDTSDKTVVVSSEEKVLF